MSEAGAGQERELPLYVDLDGSLVAVDTLRRSLVGQLRTRPWSALAWPLWLASGRAGFKERVARQGVPDPRALPYNDAVIDYVRRARGEGRTVVLATAAHERIAAAVAAHLGLFDHVLATRADRNLKGARKRDAILADCARRTGGTRFEYLGDGGADLPIWRVATRIVAVDPGPTLRRRLEALDAPLVRLPGGSRARAGRPPGAA